MEWPRISLRFNRATPYHGLTLSAWPTLPLLPPASMSGGAAGGAGGGAEFGAGLAGSWSVGRSCCRGAVVGGFSRAVRPGRKGSDSGPCISSRWGLWTFDGVRLVGPPPRPRERASLASDPASGEGTETPPLRLRPAAFTELLPARASFCGRLAASPYFFAPASAPALSSPRAAWR